MQRLRFCRTGKDGSVSNGYCEGTSPVLDGFVFNQTAGIACQPGIGGNLFQLPGGEIVEFFAFAVAKLLYEEHFSPCCQSYGSLRFHFFIGIPGQPGQVRFLQQRASAVSFPGRHVFTLERIHLQHFLLAFEPQFAMANEILVGLLRLRGTLAKTLGLDLVQPVIPFQNFGKPETEGHEASLSALSELGRDRLQPAESFGHRKAG